MNNAFKNSNSNRDFAMTLDDDFPSTSISDNIVLSNISNNNNDEIIDIKYICETCGECFQKASAISSHNKWKHRNIVANYKCKICDKIFLRKSHLERHEKSMSCNKDKHINCYYCNFKASKKKDGLIHYQEDHMLNIISENLFFDSFEKFQAWKAELEKKTKSCFVKPTRTRLVNNVKVTKYICHRDGLFCSKGKGIRHQKLGGSNKINYFCPANITAYVTTDKNVKVEYIKTHVGHELDLRHLNISQCEKDIIAQKLALKIPFENILDEIRDSVMNGVLERIHLITRKDLWNIASSYNLNHEEILNKNDYLSVETWIMHMQKTSNAIRFYKPQGVYLEHYPVLKKEDFLLILMNDAQKTILQKFGNDCVCIDGTHGLNAYDFQLYTLMILDDLRQGFPCSFLFSNRGDAVVMEIYFKIIKVSINDSPIHPKVFMSDMDEAFYNAWITIIGPVENRLYCSWHVDRAWRQNLNKISTKEKQAIVYKKIKIIMYELDMLTFKVMVDNLLQELKSDPDCSEFGKYFETYVKNNKCSTWAYCYRKKTGINTNMCLENMHKVIKHIYFGGKKVKRLDKAIIILMKFLRDKLFDRLYVLNKGKLTKKLSIIRQTHQRSLGLKNTLLDMGDFWNVSSTKCDDIYTVKFLQTVCTCGLYCQECNACIHAYSCSCIDYSIKWNMCKHIHMVCMHLRNNELTAETSTTKENCDLNLEEQIQEINEENDILNVVSTTKTDVFVKRKQEFLDNFIKTYNNIENETQLHAVIKQLAPVESIINALSKTDKISFVSTESSLEPPNKKIKKQLRFVSTKNKPKRKGKKFVNPSEKEKKVLSLQMVKK